MTDTPLTALIVDDEPLARQLMRMQLGKCQQPVRVAEAPSAALAKDWLEKNECDVIFLDIHMPDINGLEFAQQQQSIPRDKNPTIIFVTADSSHALQAFDLAALDYLTKPVSLDRLEKALKRVIDQSQSSAALDHNKKATQNLPFITVESLQQISRIPLNQILYFHADNKYTHIVTPTQSYISEESLNALEQRFDQHVTRIHRSYLVVTSAIEKLMRSSDSDSEQDCWFVKLHHTNVQLPISRRQLVAVKKLLQEA
ncbi:MAG: LytR/AlgR family response regulator transcription factor [Saezia sp.]